MKANELRVGNWVSNNEEYYQITSATIAQLERGDSTAIPIPLTEEWLIRLGFVSNPYLDRYEYELIFVQCNKTRGKTELWIQDMPHIKYVHQLQNLVFITYNEELTIKP